LGELKEEVPEIRPHARLFAQEWAKVKPEPHRQSIYVQPAQMSNQRKSLGEFSDTIKKGAWPELEPVPNFRYALFRDIEKESRFYFYYFLSCVKVVAALYHLNAVKFSHGPRVPGLFYSGFSREVMA